MMRRKRSLATQSANVIHRLELVFAAPGKTFAGWEAGSEDLST